MAYGALAAKKAEQYLKKKATLLLAIESSCDETAAAVVRGGREALYAAVHSQISIHQQYGGVVPEIASRSHVERIDSIVQAALEGAGVGLKDMDAVAVTCGPGLVGALIVGVSYAKGLALAEGLPLVGVNHIAGHIAANYMSAPDLEPPFVCLVASGGHSHIVLVEDYTVFRLLGRTLDDAAGEAFDKVARALGLPYPGGPHLERLARGGDAEAFRLPSPFNSGDGLDMSFSGIKTAIVNAIHNARQKGLEVNSADAAASFERAVVETLTAKSIRAARLAGVKTLALAGGVSANTALRESMRARAKEAGFRFYCPDFELCTDNAAMIGCAGHYQLLAGKRNGLDLNACANLPLA